METKKRVAIALGVVGYAACVTFVIVTGSLVVTLQAIERVIVSVFGG